MSVKEPDHNDPNKRLGVPPDKFGAYSVPLNEGKRVSVALFLFPPEALRDAPFQVVEEMVQQNAPGLLAVLAQEIYRSYTSDPVDPVVAQQLGETLQAHAKAQRSR